MELWDGSEERLLPETEGIEEVDQDRPKEPAQEERPIWAKEREIRAYGDYRGFVASLVEASLVHAWFGYSCCDGTGRRQI